VAGQRSPWSLRVQQALVCDGEWEEQAKKEAEQESMFAHGYPQVREPEGQLRDGTGIVLASFGKPERTLRGFVKALFTEL
jgi:hypothetical protein